MRIYCHKNKYSMKIVPCNPGTNTNLLYSQRGEAVNDKF